MVLVVWWSWGAIVIKYAQAAVGTSGFGSLIIYQIPSRFNSIYHIFGPYLVVGILEFLYVLAMISEKWRGGFRARRYGGTSAIAGSSLGTGGGEP